jgi:hypothetical protein
MLDRIMRRMRLLQQKKKALQRHLSKAEELADFIQIEERDLVLEAERYLARFDPGGDPSGTPGRTPAAAEIPATPGNEALDRLASLGVCSIDFSWHADGAKVRVGTNEPVDVPRLLAEILSCLAANDGEEAGDGLVGWKSSGAIRRTLKKRTGADVSRHALVQNISRLRGHLYAQKINPRLVQTRKRSGYRFAVRLKDTLRSL